MIRNLVVSAALAAGCLAAAPAFAASLTAQLQSPVAAPTKIVAGGATWRCEGATCVASATTDRTLAVGGCHELAKEVGAISAYEGLDAAKLAKCDAGFAAPVIAKASAPVAAAGTR